MAGSNKKGGNTAVIKRNNLSLIICLVREMGRVSRTELSRITGLSKGGLTPLIQELIRHKVLHETGVIDSEAGRKPVMLEICSDAGFILAVDLNRSCIQTALVDFSGRLRSFYEYKYNGGEQKEDIIRKMKSMVRFFLDENAEQRIVALAVSAPGPLDCREGTILNPPNFHGWRNIPVKRLLEDEFGILTVLDKDANAYAMAEKTLGLGRQYRSYIHITHSEGVGAGIVINDVLYRGTRGFGAELGHVIVEHSGKVCECGNTGCLEQYASMSAIMAWLEEKLKSEAPEKADAPLRASYEQKGRIDWEDVLNGLESQMPLCLRALERAGTYLGYGLISAVNLFAPEAVIIGGRSAAARNYLLGPIRKVISQRTFFKDDYLPDILASDLKEGALIGIANTVFEQLIREAPESFL